MITALSHASAHGGGTFGFTVGAGAGTLGFTVSKFVWKPRMVGDGVDKLQGQGKHEGNTDPRELVIDLEGRLTGSSPSDYWDRRQLLMPSILVPVDYDRTIPYHGTLTWTAADGTVYSAAVHLVDHDVPLGTESTRSTPAMISWVSMPGYWMTGGNPVRI